MVVYQGGVTLVQWKAELVAGPVRQIADEHTINIGEALRQPSEHRLRPDRSATRVVSPPRPISSVDQVHRSRLEHDESGSFCTAAFSGALAKCCAMIYAGVGNQVPLTPDQTAARDSVLATGDR